MEQWKVINGFENYSVSSYGNVRNNKTGRILKQHIKKEGYHQLQMGRNTMPQYVHRLVAMTFIHRDCESKQVDHIDGNKSNNHVGNLRWVTASENAYGYGYKQRNKNKQKPIIATHSNGTVLEFESRNATAEYFKCNKSLISYGKEFIKGNKKGWTFELKI